MSATRWPARVFVVTAALVVCCVVAEVALRIVDGYRPTSFTLQRTADARSPRPVVDQADPARVPLARGVDPAWYAQDPPARRRFAIDEDLRARAAAYPGDPITPFLVFNRRYLREQLCAGSSAFAPLRDFYYFDPIEASAYPTFRHLPNVSPPGWFPTNNFGWRGPDLDGEKPASTIRIAFVGASTTIDAFGVPFSHPEFIGHWLNVWMHRSGRPYRVEVINAGRTGIDSRSIAAIVRQEMAPVGVDLVVYYEGANQFWPGQIASYRFGRLYPKPAAADRARLPGETKSALVRRVGRVVDRVTGGDGLEPLKPPLSVQWPAGVDEDQPDPSDRRLPMDLPRIVSDLENMRTTLEQSGGEMAVSSFIWLVHAGLRLDPQRHREIYRYLNANYWPLSYAHLRRMADFQNRVFERYARVHGLTFIDVARTFPQDPDLFDDAIHMNGAGLRLQAWMYLQALVPIVEQRIDSGRWPRSSARSHEGDTPFAPADRRTIAADEVRMHCG